MHVYLCKTFMSIESLKKALVKPEYFHLPITVGTLTGCDEDAIATILSHCKEDEDGDVYLPIRKLYSLEVGLEEITEVSSEQKIAAERLEGMIMAIAQAENLEVEKVQERIKEAIDNQLTLSSLPLEWMPYYLPLNRCIGKIISSNSDRSAVNYLLSERVDKDFDWANAELGANFIKAIASKFIAPEQSGWEQGEQGDEAMGESSLRQKIESLEHQIVELTGVVSGLTSKYGESEPTTITVNSKQLQPA